MIHILFSLMILKVIPLFNFNNKTYHGTVSPHLNPKVPFIIIKNLKTIVAAVNRHDFFNTKVSTKNKT